MNLVRATLVKEIISIPRVVVAIIRPRMNEIPAVIAIGQRAPAILMNGTLVMTRSRLMTNDNSYTEFVSFLLDDGSYENLHARRIGHDVYILDNSPFYVYGVSAEDEVISINRDGRNIFSTVRRRGGHSTYRVKMEMNKTHADFLREFQPLENMGCTFEGAGGGGRRLYTIDLNPTIDVNDVYRVLEEGEEAGIWEFEEAHFFQGQGPDIGAAD